MTSNKQTTAPADNLKRLFILRNLTIVAELIMLFMVHSGFGIHLPVTPLMTIIGLLALANIWTWRRLSSRDSIPGTEIFLQLCIDVFALTGVLYFTGGASNPFAWFFLLPLIIAAMVLSARATWLMAGLTTLCYSLLMFWFRPLAGSGNHMHHTTDTSFSQHIFGMWFGFVLSAALVSWFIVGMAKTLRQRDRSLAEAREQALRDDQLVALGTLATGAAHELGTPLATMAIVSGELENRDDLPEDVQKKIQILRSQVQRCKETLSVISASAGENPAESGRLTHAHHFIEQLIQLWQSQRLDSHLQLTILGTDKTAQILDERTLQQSLINLLNNAADASPDELAMNADWTHHQLTINLIDNGPGLQPQTTPMPAKSSKEYGMGLGLFLTHSTIQRLGGTIEFINRQEGGTCTRIHLPLIA
ncbi:MAG: ATP-binding protein [Gammaproteobacteria bacterium]